MPLPPLPSLGAKRNAPLGALPSLSKTKPGSLNSLKLGSSNLLSSSSLAKSSIDVMKKTKRIQPLRFALRYSPAVLAMVYRDTKHNKTRIKTFPVAVSSHQRGNTADAVVAISNALIENNPHYLAPELIPPSQIEKMIKKLLDTQSSTAISNSSTGSASAMADYNNTTPSSHTNHDHKKSTTRHTNTNTNANNNNDDDDGAFFMPGQGKSEENLNDLTESEYQAKKAEMDVDFEQNRLRPGDAGYERDVRQEFAPAEEENDWDDSSDEDMYL